MNMEPQSLVSLAGRAALFILVLSAAITFLRLVLGPSPADRVAALDLFSVLIVAFLAAYAVYRRDSTFLDVAISYALVAFLGTVALCRYIRRLYGCADGGTKKQGRTSGDF